MNNPNDTLLTLKVGGQMYAGWKSVNVRQSVEQIAGTFELTITERWPNQRTQWSIPPGEHCELSIGVDPVIAGYVDAVSVSYDASSHNIRVSGRDRTGDLVDCSAPTTAFSGLRFAQIAQKLTAPYGITVLDETVLGKHPRTAAHVPKQATQCGESVFKTLEKLARSEGLLLVSDAQGGLRITRAGLGGDCSTHLQFGKNILSASLEHSHANLFSDITVKGQASAAGSDKFDVSHSAPKGVVKRNHVSKGVGNSQIARFRPLELVAETQADAKRCLQRAQWEASNREARARRLSVTVQGWRQANADLWRTNQRVRVSCPWMRVDEWWLVAAVAFSLDEGGSLTELTLVGEKAFDLLPEIPQPQGGGGKFNVVGKK